MKVTILVSVRYAVDYLIHNNFMQLGSENLKAGRHIFYPRLKISRFLGSRERRDPRV